MKKLEKKKLEKKPLVKTFDVPNNEYEYTIRILLKNSKIKILARLA